MRTLTSLIVAAAVSAGCTTSGAPPPLSEAQRSAIVAELQKVNIPPPSSLEVNDSGFVVATFDNIPAAMVPDGGRTFAETALIRMREPLAPAKVYKQFRVTVNGPPPGTGMISRYGSARFIEDAGKVEWKQGG